MIMDNITCHIFIKSPLPWIKCVHDNFITYTILATTCHRLDSFPDMKLVTMICSICFR